MTTGPDRPALPARLAIVLFENRHAMVLTLLVILMAGISALSNLPRIEDPRITNRFPRVTTVLPGASAARVEALVSDRIEDSLKQISEIKRIESTSRAGISVVLIELDDNVTSDTNEAVFSRIRDRLSDVQSRLPATASVPFFDDKNEAVAFSLIASLDWQRDGPPQLGLLNRLAEDLADVLRSLSGTEVVRLYGAPSEQITVTVDPDELSALGLTTATLAARIAADDSRLPAGALRNGERNLFVEVAGAFDSTARVASVPIAVSASGGTVGLGDVARVEKGWRDPPDDITRTGGARSILVAARTEPDVRLDRWSETARAAVERFAAEAGPGVAVSIAFDQSVYTESRLSELGRNLAAGALVVTLVVFFAMGWRAALIVGSALPLSASIAVFGLTFFGQQIHQMSIFGMIIAIGLLIDNAIVITDDVKRNLDGGLVPRAAIAAAIGHLFVPLLASSLTTILGFMPVFLLPGAMGDFVGPIAISVVLALVASFCLSMTLIPALAGLYLTAHRQGTRRAWYRSGLRSQTLSQLYRRLLTFALRVPALTVALCCVLPIAGFVLAGTLGNQFFPPADRDQFEIQVWMPSDASIEHTHRIARQIDEVVSAEPGVTQVNWRIGGSYPLIYYNRIMMQQRNPGYAHAMVHAGSVAEAKRLTRSLPEKLNQRFPAAQIVVSPFAQGPPVQSPVGFRLLGPDVATLKELGDQLRRVMHELPQITQTRASISGGEPKLILQPSDEAVRVAGLSLNAIAGQLQRNLEGGIGGEVLEDLEPLPVRIRYADGQRGSAAAIANAPLVTAAGSTLPVSAAGHFELLPEAGGITRYNGERSNNVFGFLRPDALAIEVTAQIRERLATRGFELPPGYRLVDAGDSEEQKEALGQLLIYLPVLLMLMITTLVLSFRSVRLAVVIGAVAVLSVGLGMLSLWMGQYALGFNAIIGSAGLIGVAINGSIVVLAAIRADPPAHEGHIDSIVEQTSGATRHIVATTATTIGGFLPLLLFSGGDFWPPLAVVIAGGVGFSITLSLLFAPAIYRLLHRHPRSAVTSRAGVQPA